MKTRVRTMGKAFFAITLLLLLAAATAVTAQAAVTREMIAGSAWYGRFMGWTGTEVLRYMNLRIEDCSEQGAFTGKAYVTTVEGQGYDSQWVNFDVGGTVDLATGDFTLDKAKATDWASGTSNWSMPLLKGIMTPSSISGVSTSRYYTGERPFSFAPTSVWAADEMTDADALGLIPETMQGEDLSKPVTRAEFAAVSVSLYESLSKNPLRAASTRFADVAGNRNESSIRKAYGAGIAVGFSDTRFAPDNLLTREEMATMLTRVIKKYRFSDWTFATDGEYYLDTSGARRFADDAEIADWAKPSVYYLVKMNVIKGINDRPDFAPRAVTDEQKASGYASATREQAIALSLRVYRITDLLER